MLTTNRPSRARLLGGVGVIALLPTAGLATTASGGQAAERVRSTVEQATGVRLAELRLPVAFQSTPPAPPPAPEAPPAPPAPTAMPAPPAPPAPMAMGPDGLHMKHRYRVILRDHDGHVTETAGDDPEAMAVVEAAPRAPGTHGRSVVRIMRRDHDGHVVTENFGPGDIPQINSANCSGPDTERPPVMHQDHGGKRVIIICQNRIERMAHDGAALVARVPDIERRAYGHALEGLRSARSRISGSSAMSNEERADALKGIDEAIREIEGDLAKVN